MDKYLTIFTEQLDALLKPETLFPDKESPIKGWLKQKFAIRRKAKRDQQEASTVNNNVEVEYV